MGVAIVGRNDITQIRLNSMVSGTQNSDSLPRRDSNLGPPYHVYNGTRCPKTSAKIPTTKGLPQTARKIIEQYLKLADWVSLLVNKKPQENDQSWASSTEIVACQESQQLEPTPSKDIGRLIQNLIHEPSEATLLAELEDIKHTLSQDTPLSWLIEIFTEEL
jgi:hypothetical protein